MKIAFSKYHGTGNDFILLDNRQKEYSLLTESQIKFLCDRRFGIGADGLILLETNSGVDFEMIYFNSDGNVSSMCGNGGRCITAFAKSLGLIKGSAKFKAIDGMHEALIEKENPIVVKLKMRDVASVENIGDDMFINTGSPHYVSFVQNALTTNVAGEGRRIRNSDRFKQEGTNVNFVEPLTDRLIVRSYERGVEDETLSCGTGVVASVLAASSRGLIESEAGVCKAIAMGGILMVHYEKASNGFKNIWLEGEATFVYKGEIEIV
jgi:diaminopimelate epimerase